MAFRYTASMIRFPQIYFSLGALCLLAGSLLWLPLLWQGDHYPVLLHRYLMLNGFVACFLGVSILRDHKRKGWIYLGLFDLGLLAAFLNDENATLIVGGLQAGFLFFQSVRHFKGISMVGHTYLTVGFLLWCLGSLWGIYDSEKFSHLFTFLGLPLIILALGCEPKKEVSSASYACLLVAVVMSFLNFEWASPVRWCALLVMFLLNWPLRFPEVRNPLAISLWITKMVLVLSCGAMALDENIHMGHVVFMHGLVLLQMLLIAPYFLSHRKIFFVITFLVVLAAATRVSAYYLPKMYLSHLAYSALILISGILIWSKLIFTKKEFNLEKASEI